MMLDICSIRRAGAVALALGMLACGSDEDGGAGDGGADGSASGGGGGVNASTGDTGGQGSGDGGSTGSDAAATTGEDAGDSGGEADAGGSGGDDGGTTGGDDGGTTGSDGGGDNGDEPTPAALLDLPADGERQSICYGEDECNGDDLVCFGAGGTEPGFCTEDCADDDDCSAVDGLEATCDSGRCLVACNGDEGEGDGPCPENMECRDLLPLPIVVSGEFWCVYPEEGGSNDVAELGACDPDHGDGDCEGERACHMPNAGADHGYCTETCEEDEDCAVPGGVSSTAVCGDGMCELDCGEAGATCPDGMNCRDVNASPLSDDFRCVYID